MSSTLSSPLLSIPSSSSSSLPLPPSDASPSAPPPASAVSPTNRLLVRLFLTLFAASLCLTLQVLLVVWGFATPLLYSSTAYTPSIAPISFRDHVSSYTVLGNGTTKVSAFQYQDTFPVLNATSTTGLNSTTRYSNDSISSSVAFDFSCSYTVYTNVSELTRAWISAAYRWQPSSGAQDTLSTSACGPLNAYRVALILLTAVLAMCWGSTTAFLVLSFLVEMKTLEANAGPPAQAFLLSGSTSLAYTGQDQLVVHQPAQAAGARPSSQLCGDTGWKQGLWLTRLYTLEALSGACFAGIGLLTVAALWLWVGAVELPDAVASGYTVAVTVVYVVVAVGNTALLVWDFWRCRGGLRALKVADDGVDLAPFRLSSLLCCCQPGQRRGLAYEG